MIVVTTLSTDSQLYWLWRHNSQVDVVFGTYTEVNALTGTKAGPYRSEDEALDHIRDIFSIAP